MKGLLIVLTACLWTSAAPAAPLFEVTVGRPDFDYAGDNSIDELDPFQILLNVTSNVDLTLLTVSLNDGGCTLDPALKRRLPLGMTKGQTVAIDISDCRLAHETFMSSEGKFVSDVHPDY
jgi:hypothetical protein